MPFLVLILIAVLTAVDQFIKMTVITNLKPIGTVSVIPALTMLHQMDTRGKVVNVAFLVSAASALAAHFGFTMGTEPQLAVPLLAAKWVGGIAGALLALAVTRPKKVSTSAGAEEDADSSSLCADKAASL